MTLLNSLEPRLPRWCRPVLGLLVCLFVWTHRGPWCRDPAGRRMPLKYRLGVAVMVWRGRYFVGRK